MPVNSTSEDVAAAEQAATLCREFTRLKSEEHLSGNQAASLLGKSPAWFSVNAGRYQRGGLAALMPERRALGADRRLFRDLPPWFVPVAKFYYLIGNLTATRGSVPEALRCTISLPACPAAVQERLIKVCEDAGWTRVNGEKLPECPASLRESILARAKAGQPMLPESLTRQITAAAPFVKQYRNPTDASLDYISAHGTQMWLHDSETGQKTFIRSGDVIECDDATINFPCVIPWPMRGCPCSEKFEVKAARFQWLVAIDVGSRKVLSFIYTARPRSSYRTEDVLSLMRCVARQHGIPRAWRLEQGVWASRRVIDATKLMGSGRLAVHSPHAKPFIEGLFNKLWTKLSLHFPDASVGRFRGEGEEAARLLTACQAGQLDPRNVFPRLEDAIAAFHAVVDEHDASQINSDNYGSWTPNERWTRDTEARPLKTLHPESEWLFSPFMRTWLVRGNTIGGKVPLFPGQSVPFQFQSPDLFKFHGAHVTAYFDPADSHCLATLVLAKPWQNHRAGEVIGTAPQTNLTTSYIRMAMGWGDNADDGRDALRAAHTALRREVRGIVGTKSRAPAISESEERDGRGNLAKITRDAASAPSFAFKTRVGKIARLPLAVREELNIRLRDGESGKRLVSWLNELNEVKDVLTLEFKGKPIDKSNLTHWRLGGYREWLQRNQPARR